MDGELTALRSSWFQLIHHTLEVGLREWFKVALKHHLVGQERDEQDFTIRTSLINCRLTVRGALSNC